MTHDDAYAIVVQVCTALRICRLPRLSWSSRAKRGRYRCQTETIVGGPRCWRGPLPALLHELAHHVHLQRLYELYNLRGRRLAYHELRPHLGRRRETHGPAFVGALKRVAAAYYGDAALYPWHNEYRSLRACAPSPTCTADVAAGDRER